MGVFSLNYHKTIHSGEGGIVVAQRDDLAERVQLIRNHAEVVVKNKGTRNIVSMLGFNLRMTEIEAAIAGEQLKKLERLLLPRIEAAAFLTDKLCGVRGMTPPVVGPEIRHGWYVYALRYEETQTGVPRARFAAALKAEGLPVFEGYVEPIYLQPVYQEQKLYGEVGCPFQCPHYHGQVSYARGICPVTERMHFREVLVTNICHGNITRKDLEDFVAGCTKVAEHLEEL